jgi:hypothetical protein
MALSKPRHSTRVKICEELDVGYPMEELHGAGVPKKKDVLRHLFHFMTPKEGQKGRTSVEDAAKKVVLSIKDCWVGSNIELGQPKTLVKRVVDIYQVYK